MTMFQHLLNLALVPGLIFVALPAQAQDAKPAATPAVKGAPSGKAGGRPALSVNLVQPQTRELPLRLAANGSVAAWQEAILGAEVNGLRLSEVRAQVGDSVKRGQVLAVLASETVEAELAQARAQLLEAEAARADARANAERAQSIAGSGALSAQQVAQYLTTDKTAQARLELARAQLAVQQLRFRHTRVTASDDGIISARTATVGAVVQQGQELFRLIRKGRVEWRGEVTATEVGKLRTGLPVTVSAGGAASLQGTLRVVGPTVDVVTRNALVYVDLPDGMKQGLKPGMFARGEFVLGASSGLTVPQATVVVRDGFSYVFRASAVQDGIATVSRIKVDVGRRIEDHIEIQAGIDPKDRIVASGVAFLSDGDAVKVVK